MILNIDFLILNYKGTLATPVKGSRHWEHDEPTPFSTVLHQYGNKTFKNVYDFYYKDLKIGLINSVPRSNIITPDLIQIQFENHLFYTMTHTDLRNIVFKINDYYDCYFDGINRLDIAIDKNDYNNKFENLYIDLIKGDKKIKGREKNVSAYMLTKNGVTQFNGFTIGKRSSSRFLRIYNKTNALMDTTNPKQYINDFFSNNGMTNELNNPIWRFEYQLNSTFFTYLRKYEKNITYNVFEMDTLLQLVQLAQKNHFDITENTNKKETNKEKIITVIDWQQLTKEVYKYGFYIVSRIVKNIEVSITIQKRLVKSLFRQYYIEQNLSFLFPMMKILNEYNLRQWFENKYNFYIAEFVNKEKYKNYFNENYFIKTYKQLLKTQTNEVEKLPTYDLYI